MHIKIRHVARIQSSASDSYLTQYIHWVTGTVCVCNSAYAVQPGCDACSSDGTTDVESCSRKDQWSVKRSGHPHCVSVRGIDDQCLRVAVL